VYEADNISSSIDRRKYEDDDTKGREKDYLNSVFNVLKPSESIENKKFRINQLRKEEFNMPLNLKGLASEGEFRGLLETFSNNLSALQEMDLDRILTIMENIFSYFPSSSYVDRPDISLYDHLKLTTALAACMYDYDKEKGNDNYKEEYFEKSKSRDINKFLLVSGELSGIQNFIYTISSKMAMKSLRGRSFYLELLTENIIDEILKELNLTRANLLYSGGSHFYLILPNTNRTEEIIEKYKIKINDFLLKNHGINLYFEISSVETNGKDLKNNEENVLGDLFKNLTLKTSKNKVQRYNVKQLKDIFNENSKVNKVRSSTKECIICKKAEDEKVLDHNAKIYHGSEICGECISFIELGSELSRNYNKRKDHFFVVDKNPNKNKLKVPFIDGSDGYINIKSEEDLLDSIERQEEPTRIYSINSQYSGKLLKQHLGRKLQHI
jgi:CRISPR-associated protein Csm1